MLYFAFAVVADSSFFVFQSRARFASRLQWRRYTYAIRVPFLFYFVSRKLPFSPSRAHKTVAGQNAHWY